MESLDIFLLTLVLLGMIWGFVSGIVSMIISVLCFLIGIYVLPDYIRAIAEEHQIKLLNSTITYYFLFAVGIALCLTLGKVLSGIVSKMLKIMFLNGINRAFGALAGLLLGVFIAAVVVKSGVHYPEKKPLISQKIIEKSKTGNGFLIIGKIFPL